jgi:hypothetical protein
MEIIIVVFGTLILPIIVIVGLFILGKKYTKETKQKDNLMETMENIIEMKNKMIKQLKSFRLFN